MIAFTKLLCGTATVREVLTYTARPDETPTAMLHYVSQRGPLVVWNITRRCNLHCLHCYYNSDSQRAAHELTLEQGMRLIEDLRSARVPVLLFSGGEPLLRREIFALGRAAKDARLHPVLSTNGVLITEGVAAKLADAGFAYVGVSLDGMEEKHDAFRGETGAFARALSGLRAAKDAGLRTGVRFTVCADNLEDLPKVLDLVETEGIPRFCLYHLVYAGRGADVRERDINAQQRRAMLDLLIHKTLDWCRRGIDSEILTVDNHADGIYVAEYVRKHLPGRIDEVEELIRLHGGCSAGTKFGSIDAEGNVHPCQFWEHVSLGNVRQRPFSEIWADESHPVLAKLRAMPDPLRGERCAPCRYRAVCGGCRVRAEAVYGDAWGDDPACYLSEEEIGVAGRAAAVKGEGRAGEPSAGASRGGS